MQKLVLSLLLGGGIVACAVFADVLLSLCLVDPDLNFYYTFDSRTRPASAFSGGGLTGGVFERSMTTTLSLDLHSIQLPFPLIKLTMLLLALLSLFAVGWLLRSLIYLHRQTADFPAKEQNTKVGRFFQRGQKGTEPDGT